MDQDWVNYFKVPLPDENEQKQQQGQVTSGDVRISSLSDNNTITTTNTFGPFATNCSTLAVPSIQDRKIFLGCLAAVLASRYDYDCKFVADDDSNNNNDPNDDIRPEDDNQQKQSNELLRCSGMDDDNVNSTLVGITKDSVVSTWTQQQQQQQKKDDHGDVDGNENAINQSFDRCNVKNEPHSSSSNIGLVNSLHSLPANTTNVGSTALSTASSSDKDEKDENNNNNDKNNTARSRFFRRRTTTNRQALRKAGSSSMNGGDSSLSSFSSTGKNNSSTNDASSMPQVTTTLRSERNAIIQRERHRRRRHQILSELLQVGWKVFRLEEGVEEKKENDIGTSDCENNPYYDTLHNLLDRLLIQHERKTVTTTTTATATATLDNDSSINDSDNKKSDELPIEINIVGNEDIKDNDIEKNTNTKKSSKRERLDVLNGKLDEIEHLRTYWKWSAATTTTAMEPSSAAAVGIQCLAMFFIELLLVSDTGYDARVRHSLKTLGVLLFLQDALDNDNDGLVLAENDTGSNSNDSNDGQIRQLDVIQFATLQFQDLERAIAKKLLELSNESNNNTGSELQGGGTAAAGNNGRNNRGTMVKAMKVGGAAIAAGVVFAMTAGLAAPAIAAGVAAAASGTMLTASAVAIITSHVAVTTVFGVGGGSLAAYRVNRRVCGLTEFEIINEQQQQQQQQQPLNGAGNNNKQKSSNSTTKKNRFGSRNSNSNSGFGTSNTTTDGTSTTATTTAPELYCTVCISGWLHDERDFQRPWGVTPTRPPIQDKLELLQRFYAVHDPSKIKSAAKIYRQYTPPNTVPMNGTKLKRGVKGVPTRKDKWYHFCIDLQLEYGGSDPHHLFPLKPENGGNGTPIAIAKLTDTHATNLELLFQELGYSTKSTTSNCSSIDNSSSSTSSCPPREKSYEIPKTTENTTTITSIDENFASFCTPTTNSDTKSASSIDSISFQEPSDGTINFFEASFDDESDISLLQSEDLSIVDGSKKDSEAEIPTSSLTEDLTTTNAEDLPRHISTVWDYQSVYGSELYTLRWESKLLREVKNSTVKLAFDCVNSGAKEILKFTILSTLVVALTVPYLLASATSLISGPWTLATDRADEAGKELARSLLVSNAGKRPVTLIGYSFGARVIYSCLKELARYQVKWEDDRVPTTDRNKSSKAKIIRSSSNVSSGENSPDEGSNDSAAADAASSLDMVELMREPASIVEDVILLGLPDRLDLQSLESCRQVVAGRFIHGYSQKDWVLLLMYNVQKVGLKPVCGTIPINLPGIENFDLTDMLLGHQDYLYKIGPILEHVRHCQPFRLAASSSSSSLPSNNKTTENSTAANVASSVTSVPVKETSAGTTGSTKATQGTALFDDMDYNDPDVSNDAMYMEIMSRYKNEHEVDNNRKDDLFF